MIEWRINHVEETASTNILAKSGRPGDVFSADFQTAGRGRLDHKWHSRRGDNLMMSAVLDVSSKEPHEVATLPLAVGLAIVEALGVLGLDLRLKWPNDIFSLDKKLAGILCERNGETVIAGIGVNVRERQFPREIASRATSLRLLGLDVGVCELKDILLKELGSVFEEWRAEGFSALWPRVAALDYLKGRKVEIFDQDNASPSASGYCGGIQENGTLLVNNTQIWAGEAHVKIF